MPVDGPRGGVDGLREQLTTEDPPEAIAFVARPKPIVVQRLQGTAKYEPIRTLVHRAVVAAQVANVAKDYFIVDIGPNRLTPKLREQPSLYNVRNPKNQIRGLWVVARGELFEIPLQ